MIYLRFQITFIFLTQVYFNMNFITSSSISSQDFPDTLRSIFANCFWRIFFVAHKKMYISEYLCKTCLNDLGILLKCRKTFEKIFAGCNSSKNTDLPKFFFTCFWQLYFKSINLLTKTKWFLLC